MKKLASSFALILLAGCAVKPAMLNITTPNANAGNKVFKISDARPKKVKESEWLSLMITSCEYGIRRIGDTDSVPNKMEILERDLAEFAPDLLAGKSIQINHYTLHLNRALALRGQMNSMYGGVIAKSMINVGCKKDEVSAGWYEATDVSNVNSPIIVDLAANVDSKPVKLHFVYSPVVELTGGFGVKQADDELLHVFHMAAKNLIADLEKKATN